MRKILLVLLVISALLLFTGMAAADIIYDVSVDTSSVSGANGFLDFTFGSGLSSQAATATITSFTGGALGADTPSGDVAGSLVPGPLTINNTLGYNDYYVAFQFGNSLSFTLTLSGDAVNMPDGISDGSTFAFSMLDSNIPQGSIIPVSDLEGFAFTTDLDNTGAATNTPFAAVVTLTPGVPPNPPGVPEPATLTMLSVGVAGLALARKRLGR